MSDSELLRETRAERVSAGDDDAVVDPEFEERIAHRGELRNEVLVGNGDFAVLVTALLLVRDLVFDLDGAGACLDHLLGQQVGGLGVTEARIDVGDDRHHVGLVVVDLGLNELGRGLVARCPCGIQLREQEVQLASIGLAQERVELLDERRYRGLLMHGLVRQRPELRAERRDHPPREVEVALVRTLQVLFDRDQLLLADEAVPDPE